MAPPALIRTVRILHWRFCHLVIVRDNDRRGLPYGLEREGPEKEWRIRGSSVPLVLHLVFCVDYNKRAGPRVSAPLHTDRCEI